MTNVLIRDLTAETHRQLLRRAEARGQSLQRYLAAELTRIAGSPTLEEVLRRVDARSGGSVGFVQAADDLADERADR